MSERISNGQFASKELGKPEPRIGTGKPGPGRPKGLPNKTTRAVKEFLAALVDDSQVQDSVKGRILKGDAVAFFRALEHVVGKPQENVNVNLNVTQLEARLKAGRDRVSIRKDSRE